jgi:hypothetical protein
MVQEIVVAPASSALARNSLKVVSIGYRPRVSAVTVESFSLGVYSSSSSSSILISLRVVYANEFSTPIRVIRSSGILVCVKLRSAHLT